MVVSQGDVFWIQFGSARGAEPAKLRPGLIISHNRFNASRIDTVVVAAVTSNLRLADVPGNVALDLGEGGLAKSSVVNISQLRTVDREFLGQRIGALSARRMDQVWQGLRLLLEPEVLDRQQR